MSLFSAQPKKRFWGPLLASLAVWLVALWWLGLPGLLIALVAHCVGGIGMAYNMVRSGDYIRAEDARPRHYGR